MWLAAPDEVAAALAEALVDPDDSVAVALVVPVLRVVLLPDESVVVTADDADVDALPPLENESAAANIPPCTLPGFWVLPASPAALLYASSESPEDGGLMTWIHN